MWYTLKWSSFGKWTLYCMHWQLATRNSNSNCWIDWNAKIMCIRPFALLFRRHYLSTHEHLHTLYTPKSEPLLLLSSIPCCILNERISAHRATFAYTYLLLSFLLFLSFSSLWMFFRRFTSFCEAYAEVNSELKIKHLYFSNIHLFECCGFFSYAVNGMVLVTQLFLVVFCCCFVSFFLFVSSFEAEKIHFMTKLRLMNNFVTDHRMMCSFN